MQIVIASSEKKKAPAIVANHAYLAVDEATGAKIRGATARIKKNLASAAENLIDVGFDLIDVKDKLSHGEFGKWLDIEFGMSIRSAQNFMSAVRMINAFGMPSEIAQAIPQKLLYQLSSPKVPGEIIVEVIEDIEQGNKVDVPAVLAKIKAEKPITVSNKKVDDIVAAIDLMNMLKGHLPPAKFKAFRNGLGEIKAETFKSVLMENFPVPAGSSK